MTPVPVDRDGHAGPTPNQARGDEHQPEVLRDRMTAAYARVGRPRRPRDWTLVPPPDRPVALPLDDQLDQRDLLAEVLRRWDAGREMPNAWSPGRRTTEST